MTSLKDAQKSIILIILVITYTKKMIFATDIFSTYVKLNFADMFPVSSVISMGLDLIDLLEINEERNYIISIFILGKNYWLFININIK